MSASHSRTPGPELGSLSLNVSGDRNQAACPAFYFSFLCLFWKLYIMKSLMPLQWHYVHIHFCATSTTSHLQNFIIISNWDWNLLNISHFPSPQSQENTILPSSVNQVLQVNWIIQISPFVTNLFQLAPCLQGSFMW